MGIGRKALDLFKTYLTAMHREYTPQYHFLADSGYAYGPQLNKVPFARIGTYKVRLSVRIKNTRELMHVVVYGREQALAEIKALLSQGGDVYALCVQVNELVTAYYLEVLQYVAVRLDPDEETVRPLFLTVADAITAINHAVFDTYDAQKNKRAVPDIVRAAVNEQLPAFVLCMLESVCRGMNKHFSMRTLFVDTPETRPYKKEHLETLLTLLTPEEFFKLREILHFYELSFNHLFEADIFEKLITHYLKNGNDGYPGNDLAFYMYYYERTTLTDDPRLQERFAARFSQELTAQYETLSGQRIRIESHQKTADIFGNLLKTAEKCPYLTRKMRAALTAEADALFEKLKTTRRGLFGRW